MHYNIQVDATSETLGVKLGETFRVSMEGKDLSVHAVEVAVRTTAKEAVRQYLQNILPAGWFDQIETAVEYVDRVRGYLPNTLIDFMGTSMLYREDVATSFMVATAAALREHREAREDLDKQFNGSISPTTSIKPLNAEVVDDEDCYRAPKQQRRLPHAKPKVKAAGEADSLVIAVPCTYDFQLRVRGSRVFFQQEIN